MNRRGDWGSLNPVVRVAELGIPWAHSLHTIAEMQSLS